MDQRSLRFSALVARRWASNDTKGAKYPKIPYPPLDAGSPSTLFGDNNGVGLGRRFKGWWEFYVRGENPDYPIRRRSFEYLWSRGVDVYKMSMGSIENWGRWVEIRHQHRDTANPKFHPQFPYDTTLEDKLRRLQRQIPRRDPEWKMQKMQKK